MAASYETGGATSPVDLVQKLVTWLTHANQGWTSDSSVTDGSGHRAHLHKGGQYVNLRAAMNESIWNYNQAAGYGIGLYLGDGYSGAANWRSQSGGPIQSATANVIGAGMFLNSGAIVAYHFFHDGSDHITVVVEYSPGIFTHMGWGPTLVKTGFSADAWYFFGAVPSFYNTARGGGVTNNPGIDFSAYTPMSPWTATGLSAKYSTAFIRVDASLFSARWISNADNVGTSQGYTGRECRSAVDHNSSPLDSTQFPSYRYLMLFARLHQTSYPGAMLLPNHQFAKTAAGRWTPAGYPPTVFLSTAVGHGFSALEIYAVGGVNYMVFPNFAVKKAA